VKSAKPIKRKPTFVALIVDTTLATGDTDDYDGFNFVETDDIADNAETTGKLLLLICQFSSHLSRSHAQPCGLRGLHGLGVVNEQLQTFKI
jgi:hypothetical protein